jgi:hypothetical protein
VSDSPVVTGLHCAWFLALVAPAPARLALLKYRFAFVGSVSKARSIWADNLRESPHCSATVLPRRLFHSMEIPRRGYPTPVQLLR